MYGLYRTLVWCVILIDDSSETLSGQPLGACRREKWYRDVPFTNLRMEWQALSKARNNADDRLASRPKGSQLRPGYCVAMLEKGKPFPAHCALSPGLSWLLESSISMTHHTSPDNYVNPTGITYPFPAKGRDLPEGVYWHITGHSNGSLRCDMSATRFNEDTGGWTISHPASAGFEGDANRLIWNVPVYAPADGLILGCWRAALDGDDPAEAGCGKEPADPSVVSYTV